MTRFVILQVVRAFLLMATAAVAGASFAWLEQSKQARQWIMEDMK
jgi:hypothetical protein